MTLLSTREAAAQLGVSIGTFSNALKSWGLTPTARQGNANLYSADVILRLTERRTEKTSPRRQSRPDRAPRHRPDNPKRLSRSDDLSLTLEEQAVVWTAYLAGTLGPLSPYRHSPPPLQYRHAWAAREAVRADASESVAA